MTVWSVIGAFTTFPSGLLFGFPALLSVTDPLGNSVMFSQFTAGMTRAERVTTARRVGLYACILLLVSLWAGSYALSILGITLPALKVGGGLVVAASGWRLLYAPEQDGAAAPGEEARRGDIAFFPITMPLVVGPGAISVATAMGAARFPGGFDAAYLLGLSCAAVLDAVLIAVLFSYADNIGRLLGEAGSRVVKRIVSLYLLTMGIQIMVIGLQEMLAAFLATARG